MCKVLLSGMLDSTLIRRLLAGGLGASGILCFSPFDFFWLAPLVWGGWFALLQKETTPRSAMLNGLFFGLWFFCAGVSWVYVSLAVFGGMPWWMAGFGAFAFCAAMALYPALLAWLFRRFYPSTFGQQALWFAVLVVAVDGLRSWFLTGFPWLVLGYSQTPPSPLAGFAPLFGVLGLSGVVAWLAASLSRWRWAVLSTLLLVSGGWGLGQIAWTEPEGAPFSVALLQGNVPQEMKFRPEAFWATLARYEALMAEHPAQLTVLPETAFPVFLDQMPLEYLQRLKELAQRQQGDVLFGVVTGDSEAYFNSAVSVGASPSQRYSKDHLVPFGEFIPAGFAWFMRYADIPASSFSSGRAQSPMQLAGQRVAVNICYEDVFGGELAHQIGEAGLLINLSNTAWFGHSLAQPQHLQIARMRALETGRPMLRATNTGMTAIISSNGYVESVLPAFETGVLHGNVQARVGETPYMYYGNGLVFALLGVILFAAQWRRGPSRSEHV